MSDFVAPGTSWTDDVATGARPRAQRLATNLTDLARELTPFSIAPLAIYGGFAVDPVEDYVARSGIPWAHHDFPSPLFEGLARHDSERLWEHRLYFVRRDDWGGLHQFLAGVAVVDRKAGRYARVLPHVVWSLDPMSITPVRIGINVLGYDGSDGRVLVGPNLGPKHQPAARYLPPDAGIVREAQQLFQPDANPADALSGKPS